MLTEYPGRTNAGPTGATAFMLGFGFDCGDEFGAGGAVAGWRKIAPPREGA
jgi:hypothetical protein